jgi:acetate kinase
LGDDGNAPAAVENGALLMPDRRILTLNAGSSSLKFGLYAVPGTGAPLAVGQVEGIGGPTPRLTLNAGRVQARDLAAPEAATQTDAMARVWDAVSSLLQGAVVAAVGHRIVHGGARFAAPMALDADVMAELAKYENFAPLHQPHNLAGVRVAAAAFPDALQVGCFDTAFHRSMGFAAESFGLPQAMHDRGIKRYGFHGLSYQAIARKLAEAAPDLAGGQVIVAHLGSGASLCAMKGGRSVATTMGFSPLDGLVMSTRCGRLDPGVILHLMQNEGMDGAAITDLLYRRSGLKGLSGETGDMQVLLASDAPAAAQALSVWVLRARQEIASMAAAMEGVDALVFTAGIGERSAEIRARVCAGLGWMGIGVDRARNMAGAAVISTDSAPVSVRVIATDEEGVIARAAGALLGG